MTSAASPAQDKLARRGEPDPEVGPTAPEDDVPLSLTDHLQELRVRLKYTVMSMVGGIVVCYAFAEQIFHWLMAPVFAALPQDNRQLIFTSAIEPFFVYLKVGAYAGLFASAPLVLWQGWKFVAPGLYRSERRLAVPFVTLGTLFFIAGGAFCRYVVLPFAFQYMVEQFSTEDLKAFLSMQEQLSLVLTMVLAFGIIFELPLILTLLAKLRIVSSKFLRKHRRWALVLNLILAALITPSGDAFNLMLMAGPMVLCYELGILGARLVEDGDEENTRFRAGDA